MALASVGLVVISCSKPRTEAPMLRHTVSTERPAQAQPATEQTGREQAQPPAFSYEILEHSTPKEMFADSTVTVLIKVKNTSNRHWAKGGVVRMGFSWIDEQGKKVEQLDGRGLLRKDAKPGAAVFARCKVKAPSKPGSYRLILDMIEENVAWFGAKGAKPVRVPVTVR
jgi:hypothetical protein